jgi:hypothetical protein
LQVTGSLNADTLGALGVGGTPPAKPVEPAKPAKREEPVKPRSSDQLNPPAPGESAPPKPKPKDFLREEDARGRNDDGAPIRPPRPALERDDSGVISPPRGLPPAVQDDFSVFYHGTPYAIAPREVQVSVLRKAQEVLARQGFYRADLDGLPGPSTQEALFDYQDAKRLTHTGRLDLRTLANMNLLPGRGPDAPPLKPFYNPNRRRDPSVDQRGLFR